ncbi:MAG: DUF4215 domain-containing protein [Nannocystales bacterium]
MAGRRSGRAASWGLCTLLLTLPAQAHAEVCGDGLVDSAEACDLGIGNEAGLSCTPHCTTAVCGDGVQSNAEACDDNNTLSGDGCSAECRDESEPRWSVSIDADAAVTEWFDGLEHAGDQIFVLHHASDVWQEWSSTLLAYDLDGNLQWKSFFGPPPHNQIGDVVVWGDRLFVGGRRFGAHGGTDAVIGAYTLDGSVIGESQLLGVEGISVVLIGPDGDLFLGGQLQTNDIDLWFGRYSIADDGLRWSSSEPRFGVTENVRSGAFDPEVGLYFSGELGLEAFVLRLDPNSGERLWEDRPPMPEGAFESSANGLAVAGEQVVIVGTARYTATKTVDFHSQGWVAAYTFEGEHQWDAIEAASFPGNDGLTAVAATGEDSVIVAGYQEHEGLAAPVDWDRDGLLVEYRGDGTRGREIRYDGPLHHADNFSALVVLDEDRVLASGTSMGLAAAEVGLLAEFELPPNAERVERPSPPPTVQATAATQAGSVVPRGQTLYLDFDGASVSPGNDGRLEQLSCIDGAFDYPGLDADRAFVEATVEHVRQQLEPFDINVVWESRPEPSLPYTTVLVGGAPEQLGFDASTQGYACQVDCGDRLSGELVLAFENNSEQALANTIVHEAAHAWGLDHVIDNASLMSPFSPVEEATLLDRCVEISEETSSPVCIEEHANFCPPGEQNERSEMMARFGPQRVDTQAPVLLGLPNDEVQLEAGDPFLLRFEVADDSGNPGVELRVPSLGIRKTLDPSDARDDVYLPPGEHLLEVRGIDHAGNETTEQVMVRVAEPDAGETDASSGATGDDEGEDESDTEPEQAQSEGDPSGCACTTSQCPLAPTWLLWIGVASALTRRGPRGPQRQNWSERAGR